MRARNAFFCSRMSVFAHADALERTIGGRARRREFMQSRLSRTSGDPAGPYEM